MSDGTTSGEELVKQLKVLMASAGVAPVGQMGQMGPMPGPMMQPGPMGTGPMMGMQPGPMQAPGASGLLIPITIPTPEGEATCYLQFGPEAAANPGAVIMGLMQAGWPVKVWRPKQNGYGGGGGGGGYGGGGGGYNRGGGYGGRGRW
jgi:hypothetical protein